MSQPDPGRIMQIAMGFWPAKTLLSAVELRLFTHLSDGGLSGEAIRERLGLHPRGVADFLDGLVSLQMLERHDDGAEPIYTNTPETAQLLDANRPGYIGGFLEMANARLYPFWGDLTEAL